MNSKVYAMAGLAVAFGAIAYFAGNHWLESQAQARMNEIESHRTDTPAVELSTVVVAAARLRFGETLTADKLKQVPWPVEAVPQGGYRTIEEALGNGERKAIKTIEEGEPLLAVKVTGDNARAGLAGIIAEGMRAVTIPVDLVNGVGGFVMPGDRVDIVLTKRDDASGEQIAKIIMENVKVLSIDQDADRTVDGPKVAKSVTLETDAQGAQRLALSNAVGRLSLLLRSAGDDDLVSGEALAAGELSGRPAEPAADGDANDDGFFSFLGSAEKKRYATVTVVKREEAVTHSVPVSETPRGARTKDGQR